MTNEQPKRGRGRPPKTEATDPATSALGNMQYALDRACAFICDSPTTSYVARVARAVKHGVPRAKAEAGLAAMEAAVKDARATIERVYASPAPTTGAVQRISLIDESD